MTILKCPTCSIQGIKQNLAEILPGGSLKILRSNPYQQDYTIIDGEQFNLRCGKCNTLVFYKRPLVVSPPIATEVMIAQTYKVFGTFLGGSQ